MKRWLLFFLAALIVAILHLQVFFSGWGERFEALALDSWFILRGEIEPSSDVVILAMDESSYNILGVPMNAAWPRSLHAQVLQKLKEFEVKRVVMDILFLDKSPNEAADQALSDAIKLSPTVLAAESSTREITSGSGSFTMEELLQPPDLFSKNASAIAIARLPDDFGAIRRFVVPKTKTTKDIPTLFEAAAGVDLNNYQAEKPSPRDFLWFYGPAGTIPTYSIHQVLNSKGALPASIFKDKIVYVGLSLRTELGPAQKDSYRTPFYQRGSMFGVEIQATATSNLLENEWIKRASTLTEGSIIFVVTFFLAAAVLALRPLSAGCLILAYSTAWAFISYFSFLSGLFIPGTFLVCILLPLLYLGSTLTYYFITQRSQQQVEKAFQMYLSPEMAKQMRSNSNSLGLGGESLYATALFTDIEGFTSITESMTASEVSSMLNAYFTEVMNIVFENKGTLIKFIGDAVFALWGAPIKDADHARLACETALGIQREVEKFNASKRFPALNTRIGINTGTMVVGNLGSSRRFDYTAIGDSVNLAARLEGMNKYFATDILVSESVKREVSGRIKMLSMGLVVVSGKTESVEVFSIFQPDIDDSSEATWVKALNKFRIRDWKEAKSLFMLISTNESRLSTAAKLYLSEIERYANEVPGDDWIGQISFTNK